VAASGPEESRLLPQYSFRSMAVGMTTLALAAFAYRQSSRGSIWAESLVFATATIGICFLAYAVLFLIAWVPALLVREPSEDIGLGNPFADAQLPPQVLPPRDPVA
jgi:hypothetical protein